MALSSGERDVHQWYDDFLRAVLDELGSDTNISLEDLAGTLADDGWFDDMEDLDPFELPELVADMLAQIDEVWLTADDIVVAIAPLIDGRHLTHRLTEDELADGVVAVAADLEAILWERAPGPIPLAAGGELRFAVDAESAAGDPRLEGPKGWLDGFAPGDLALFVRDGETLSVGPVGSIDEAVVARSAAALADAFEEQVEPGEGELAAPLVFAALIDDVTLFREAVLPVTELLERAGYERDGELFGPADEDWEGPAERAERIAFERLLDQFDLGPCCRTALAFVYLGWGAFTGETDVPAGVAVPSPALLDALGHGDVAEVFVTAALGPSDVDPDGLDRYLAKLSEAGGRPSAAPSYARALLAERRGDSLAGERHAADAHRADAAYAPAAQLLGWYALDRDDLARARRLLEQGDAPEEVIEVLQSFLAVPAGVGRNDPCVCGSGRKFKACCQRAPKVPPARRAALVHSRVKTFATMEPVRAETVDVYLAAISRCPDVERLTRSDFIADLALYEGGTAQAYLDRRGPLLTAADRDLVERLVAETRRLWAIEAVGDSTVTLRDTGRDGAVRVVQGMVDPERQPGEHLLGRVVSFGGEDLLVGTSVVIDLRHRAAVLDLVEEGASAEAWAEWYGDAHAAMSSAE